MFKRALVSTSNKAGLAEFLKPWVMAGCEIVSTGGTSQFLREKGLKVTEVSEVTGFPEVMDGRVRTLHPLIHMGLLARSDVSADAEVLKKHGGKLFDLVVVNLYPFEETLKKVGVREKALIEEIDVGGPSMLRAAAKSFERMTVICDPADYALVTEKVQSDTLDLNFRKNLAAKVFSHCAFYDGLIAQALGDTSHSVINLREKQKLRYGENPHQKATWYSRVTAERELLSLSDAEQLQGKELSYNNILDLEAAVGVASDFSEPACAIIKHLSPCGVALGRSTAEAFQRAFEADSISAFGGIVAFNRPIAEHTASQLTQIFLECVIAPSVEPDALKILAQKKNLRVLVLKDLAHRYTPRSQDFEARSLRGGMLLQSVDVSSDFSSQWKVIGDAPSEKIKKDLAFAQAVVRHVKSNGIVVVSELKTLGICGGQTNRIDSVRWALERAQKNGSAGKTLVLGSDAFFPFRDSIDLAGTNGVRWIIQPGGSLKDTEVEAAARERNINMVITGQRHFKH